MDIKWIEFVNEKLEIILEEAVFEEKFEQIFRLRYGIKCKRLEVKDIAKQLKIPQKKLKQHIEKIDNKVFNILKKHALLS